MKVHILGFLSCISELQSAYELICQFQAYRCNPVAFVSSGSTRRWQLKGLCAARGGAVIAETRTHNGLRHQVGEDRQRKLTGGLTGGVTGRLSRLVALDSGEFGVVA